MKNDQPNHEPNQAIMAFRFSVLILQIVVGLIAFIYTSSWILFAIWLAVTVTLYTVARKNICGRCEGYGKKCYSFYSGLYTSKLYPYQEGKPVTFWPAMLEGLSLAGMNVLPFVSLFLHFDTKGVPLLLAVYSALFLITWLAQFHHACRHCVEYATDEWKKLCPAYKLGQKLWG
jgi:hypothetical protein